jgi:transcriptional regulator with XRE-family HTH domain
MSTEQTELGRFLRTRRAGVRPADVGLPAGLGTRRTPGLRREELATLAGVSIDYYTRLERGKETRPSPAVVDALARALWPDWEQKARGCVAHLHAVAGADPDAPDLAAIIGELIVKSPDFSRLWDRYEVRRMGDGEKVFRHPVVGTMTLAHESLELTRTDGQRLVVYMAAPGTTDYDAMVLLDMAGFAAATPEGSSHDSGVSPKQ